MNTFLAHSAVAAPRPSWSETLRRRYFPTPLQGLVSAVSLALLLLILWKLLDWAFLSAVFGADGSAADCRAAGGACWSVIANRWRIIFFGLYPYAEQWRSALAGYILAPARSAPPTPRKRSVPPASTAA